MGAEIWQLARGRSLDLSRPRIAGILNLTPDSFFDGGRFSSSSEAVTEALRMTEQGADFIDLGGESSRPGAEPVGISEELDRVLPLVDALVPQGVLISVDTRRPEVAGPCLEVGAHIINDIEGGRSPAMLDTVAKHGAGYILMHMRGTPGSMQKDTHYADLQAEVRSFFLKQASEAQARGIASDAMVLDPGVGFGKSAQGCIELIAAMGPLRDLGFPLLLGASRKSFLASFGQNGAERLEGSIAAALWCVGVGVRVFRVHDVAATQRALAVYWALEEASKP